MNNLFKVTASELYIKKIKEVFPSMKKTDLELLRVAFTTGFNMGCLNDETVSIQELALKTMVG